MYRDMAGSEPPSYVDHVQLARWIHEHKHDIEHEEFVNLKKTSTNSRPEKKTLKKNNVEIPSHQVLENMTVSELKALCRTAGFVGSSKCSKKEMLIEFIESNGKMEVSDVKKVNNFTTKLPIKI
jgi:hypothetical protein